MAGVPGLGSIASLSMPLAPIGGRRELGSIAPDLARSCRLEGHWRLGSIARFCNFRGSSDRLQAGALRKSGRGGARISSFIMRRIAVEIGMAGSYGIAWIKRHRLADDAASKPEAPASESAQAVDDSLAGASGSHWAALGRRSAKGA